MNALHAIGKKCYSVAGLQCKLKCICIAEDPPGTLLMKSNHFHPSTKKQTNKQKEETVGKNILIAYHTRLI
jgi:hypothetical protein